MTRDEAVSLIQQQLGFRTDQTENIITALKLAQLTLEKSRTLPWWLKSERSYIYTTANEERVPVPSDFLREDEGSQLAYIPATALADGRTVVHLDKDTTDHLEAEYQQQTGPPEAYSLDGDYFRIFPTPDDQYQIRMVYMRKDAVLDTNVENRWLANLPYLLMGAAGRIVAGSLRDDYALKTFGTWVQEGLLLLQADNEAREHVNMDYQIGGPH